MLRTISPAAYSCSISARPMPRSASILPFRPKSNIRPSVSRGEARAAAESYLDTPKALRSDAYIAETLAQSDILLAICAGLKARLSTAPAGVFDEGSAAYQWVLNNKQPVGLFDERDFFLGELASLTSGAARYLDRLQECEKWLDRAEAAFRHTLNPTPLLANIAYARLALKQHQGRYEDVLDLLPWLETSFTRLEMDLELAKTRFLKVLALKQLGRCSDALGVITPLCEEPVVSKDKRLLAQILIAAGELNASQGDYESSIRAYQEAIPLVNESGRTFVGAELKWGVGDAYRLSSQTLAALEAYQSALEDYRALEMEGKEATVRLAVAEVLLEAGRPREAEWQILAALPTIDREKMVPEGFAAVAILNESVRQRRTDPKALGDLRQYLQAKN